MIAYSDLGHGHPLILIHGFCEDQSIWKHVVPELSKKYRVITPDLPGFGETRFLEDSLTIEYFAEKIQELVTYLNIEKCLIIGHSLGGYVALAFAEKYENKLNGLGLFHSTAFEDSIEKKENRLKAIEFIKKFGVKQFAESFIPPLFTAENRIKFKPEIDELIKVASNTTELSVVETTLAMRKRKDRSELLLTLNIPVMFIVGKQDTAVPIEKSLEQCHLPQVSSVYFIQNAGHMAMIENKDLSIKCIDSFMAFCLKSV